ncbi:hypothetical protein ACQ5SP_00685 [Rhodovulum sp. YNF3179]
MRRLLMLILCAGAFWAGMRVERVIAVDRCLDLGGTVTPQGLCLGAER